MAEAEDDKDPGTIGTFRHLREWLSLFAMAALVFFSIRWFLFEPFRIPSESMLPTLEVGDMVVAASDGFDLESHTPDAELRAHRGDLRGRWHSIVQEA